MRVIVVSKKVTRVLYWRILLLVTERKNQLCMVKELS